MAITLKKSRLGKQDLLWDTEGTNAAEAVTTSDNKRRAVTRLNAGHIPVTAATRLKKGADDVVVAEINVDTLLQAILDELNQIGIPDGTTLEFSSGTLQIKGLGVDTAQLAALAVEEAKIGAGAVSNGKLAPTSGTAAVSGSAGVGTNVIEAASIDYTEIADNAIRNDQINADAVNNDSIADDAVSEEHLDSGCRPAYIVKVAGTLAWSGGGTTATVLDGDVANGDIVQATWDTLPTELSHISVDATAGSINFTLSTANASNDGVIAYTVFTPIA